LEWKVEKGENRIILIIFIKNLLILTFVRKEININVEQYSMSAGSGEIRVKN